MFPDPLLGRVSECGQLAQLIDSARDGFGGAILLQGEAGIGKTALLNWLHGSASASVTVFRLVGIETEMSFAYSGLRQLLGPLLSEVDALPKPQRDAMYVAFGVRDGPAPNSFHVALATLTLLTSAGSHNTVVCLVDDTQWIDSETVEALRFTSRRLMADHVIIVFSQRKMASGHTASLGFPELDLTGLTTDGGSELLKSSTRHYIDIRVARQLVTLAEGNPLALLQCGRALTPSQLAGRDPLPDILPLGSQLENAFAIAIANLTRPAKQLLLTLAAYGDGAPDVLWRAGAVLGFAEGDTREAHESGIIDLSPHIRFRHPLARAAVYYAAPEAERAQTHKALADATALPESFLESSWHLAQATSSPSESVAVVLESAGDLAASRGDISAAGRFLTRATLLSQSLTRQGPRAYKAATWLASTGSLDLADSMLNRIPYNAEDPTTAQIDTIRGRILFQRGRPADAAATLIIAARSTKTTDPGAAQSILIEAFLQSLTSGVFAAAGVQGRDIAEATRELLAISPESLSVTERLLAGYCTLFLEGLAVAAAPLREAIEMVMNDPSEEPDMLRTLRAAGTAATFLADDRSQLLISRRLATLARKLGDIESLYVTLASTGTIDVIAGRLGRAETEFAELRAIDEARGRPLSFGQLLVSAWRGDESESRRLHALVIREAEEYEQGYQLAMAAWAISILALAHGRYEEAWTSLLPYLGQSSSIKTAIPDAIEAATRCGKTDEAVLFLNNLSPLASVSQAPRIAGLAERCQALLEGDSDAAEAHYLRAIELHQRSHGSLALGRSQLVYGEWLRRRRRLKDARPQLRSALSIFQQCGLKGFAARAAAELRLAGEANQLRPVEAVAALTQQERDIARLAASGASNSDIASVLFISSNTVDYHLRKVYKKLGLTSRHELATALAEDLPQLPGA